MLRELAQSGAILNHYKIKTVLDFRPARLAQAETAVRRHEVGMYPAESLTH